MKRWIHAPLTAAAVTALGLASANAVRAQAPTVPTQPAAKPFTVKLGGYFPSDGDVKDNVGSTWFSFGLNYDIGKTKTESPVVYGAYLDGTFSSKSKDGTSFKDSVYGLGAEGRYYFGKPTEPVTFYAGGGAGAYFLYGKDKGGSQNNVHLGLKLLAGVEFKQGFLGEVSYTFTGDVRGSSLSGFGAYVGYRF